MELRDLRILLGVLEAGSFTRAGQDLHLVQSGVSKAIARLEREVGLPLLERRRDGARATEHGRALAVHAAEVIAAAERAEQAMALRRDEVRGRVLIGILPTITPLVLEGLLRRLHRRLPEVTIEVRELSAGALGDGFARGELDAIVAWGDDDELTPGAERTVSIPLVAAVRPDHRLAKGVATLDDLAAERWVTFPSAGPGRRWLAELAGRGNFQPQIANEVETLAEMKAFVLAGVGIALLPAGAVGPELRAGELATVSIPEPVPSARLVWASERRRSDCAITGVRTAMREILALLAAGEAIIPIGDDVIADGRLPSGGPPRTVPVESTTDSQEEQ